MKINELGLPSGAVLRFDSIEGRDALLQVLSMPSVFCIRLSIEDGSSLYQFTDKDAPLGQQLLFARLSLERQLVEGPLYFFEVYGLNDINHNK